MSRGRWVGGGGVGAELGFPLPEKLWEKTKSINLPLRYFYPKNLDFKYLWNRRRKKRQGEEIQWISEFEMVGGVCDEEEGYEHSGTWWGLGSFGVNTEVRVFFRRYLTWWMLEVGWQRDV